jgi:tripartite-type tricarboxylate transporter receptor subunit TctC
MSTRRDVLASAACLAAAPWIAMAQEAYPARPVRMLVPYAPGGATDIVARMVGEEMRRSLGQPFVVENRPGAAGILAVEAMARARPDGYTLMVGNVTTNAITPVLFQRRMSIDYERDVVPVARLADLPAFLLATTTNFPARSLAEAIDHARRHPGRVNYCSSGVGSYQQFDSVMLGRRENVEMIHVPMPGGAGPTITELLSGNLHLCFLNVATSAGLVRDGRIRALAVASEARLPDFPEVPTMAELGYPGIGTIAWQALFAPAETPRPVLLALNRAANDALRAEAVQEGFRRQGMRPMPETSLEQARDWLLSELSLWRRTATEAAIDLG